MYRRAVVPFAVLAFALATMTQVLADDENATPSLWKRPSLWASLVTAGVVGGAALNSFTDNPRNDFRVEHEGWFGERR